MAHSKVNLKVFVPFDRPVKRKRQVVKPDMKALGPRFKDRAKAIADSLKALSPEDLGGDTISLQVDGSIVEIEKSLISFETIEEEVRGEEIVPHVIEPSFGIDRIIYGVLDHAYYEDTVDGEARAVLRFKAAVAPVEVAVLPLMDREELLAPANKILQELRGKGFRVDYDTSGSIGRRYRRNDEIGTPYDVTIDYETVEQGTVTIRDRDSLRQVRVKASELAEKLQGLLSNALAFEEAGQLFSASEKQ
jgi:glycyl-tRNA synthetase